MARRLFEFGPFRVDPVERLLLRDGQPVYVTPKAFDVLVVLLRNAGRLIEKSEFMTQAWADSFVEEGNLMVAISTLRKAIEKGTTKNSYIQTVAKRGYRFVGEVNEIVEQGRIRSLAVLPFQSLTSDSTYDYLRVGLVDAIITRLASTGQLVVRPTSALLRYENKVIDPVAIGREQRVDAVLTGHIEVVSDRIRVAVQLVRVDDGFLLWATSYDKNLHDIFSLEDTVAEGVARVTISAYASEGTQLVPPRRTSENSKAYRLYLQGRYFWNKRTPEGLRQGIKYFQQAIAEDPFHALAYAGLADCYVLLASHGVQSPSGALPLAKQSALKALKLDDSLAEAHTSLGMIHFYYEWDWQTAEQEFKRAILLNPNYLVARMWYASNLASLGKIDEALLHVKHCEELDPLSLGVQIKLGRLYYWSKDYDRAIEAFQEVISLNPQHARAHTRLGMTYAVKGAFAEAIEEFKEAQRLSGPDPYLDAFLGYVQARLGKRAAARKILEKLKQRSHAEYVPAFTSALVYVGLGDQDSALDWLLKAYKDRSSYMVFAKVEPLLDPLRSRPRLNDLLRRMGLL